MNMTVTKRFKLLLNNHFLCYSERQQNLHPHTSLSLSLSLSIPHPQLRSCLSATTSLTINYVQYWLKIIAHLLINMRHRWFFTQFSAPKLQIIFPLMCCCCCVHYGLTQKPIFVVQYFRCFSIKRKIWHPKSEPNSITST